MTNQNEQILQGLKQKKGYIKSTNKITRTETSKKYYKDHLKNNFIRTKTKSK